MAHFKLQNIAQIKEAELELGDFTVLIGPQASGKSIFLQLMKLALDGFDIKSTIKRYGYDWNGDKSDFLQLYFGEGMGNIIKEDSRIALNNKPFTVQSILSSRRGREESVFLIPAQRVMTVQNGWPRNFMSYETFDPYVVKKFSEDLRLLMEAGLGAGSKSGIFPQSGRMKKQLRDKIDESIFFGASVKLDKRTPKKRIMLDVGNNEMLPYMEWSAGQREFMPLLLGLYWLMPSSKIQKRDSIKYVVIEEPEMGLHPMAIQALLLSFLELIQRGYKVIVSTHSPVVLELCWTIRMLQQENADSESLFRLFEIPRKSRGLKDIFKSIVEKSTFKTYYFSRENSGVFVKDISSLDPSLDDDQISEWGGITSFGSRASEIISNTIIE